MKAYIGMGSNLGDGKMTLQDAWQSLGEIEGISLNQLSSPYSTAPVDMKSGHWFTNAVGCLEVTLTPLELLQTLLSVETSFGRKRDTSRFGYQDRRLDLDLLYCGDVTMDTPELVIPHPRIPERLFVLEPLAELDPEFKDYVSGKTVAEMRVVLRERIGSAARKEQEIVRGSWDE